MEEKRIKKGWDIYLYYWTIFALVIFWLVNYYSRNFKVQFSDISLMISVLSFLFGFLVNINFSMLMFRINALKSDLAAETGRLVSLYSFSKNLGAQFHEKVRELIDEYTINTLRNYDNYEVGRSVLYRMHQDLELIENKNDTERNKDFVSHVSPTQKKSEGLGDFQKLCASSFVSALSDWEQIRERLEYLTSTKTEWSLKIAAYLLGSLLIVLLFLNRGDTFSNSLFVILSTVIVFLFLLIEDYDSLRIGDYAMNISNSEQLFDLIGKERYYPEKILGRVRLEVGKTYRIGVYNQKEKQERIFRIVYSPNFKFRLSHMTRGLWRNR